MDKQNKFKFSGYIFSSFVLLMLTFSILSVCLTKNVKAGTGDVPVLAISLLNQDPNPVEPGNFFKLRFKIENSGYAEAKNVQFEILPEFPISIYQDSTTKNITSISPAQLANEAVNIDFNLKVDSNALPGEHQLNIKYKVEGGYWTKIDPITISVKQHDVIVSLNSVNFTPQIAKPGDELSLKLNLQNLADTQVRYLTIKLGLVSVITTSTSVTKTELPFSPVSSTDTVIFPTLGPKQEVSAEFNLIVDPDAKSKVYKIPVTYTYTDLSNIDYSKENYISVVVGDTPDMLVNLESSKVYKSGMQGEVTVKFINKGLNDVKFLYAKLNPTDDYDLLTPTKVYVGKVDSDDYSTVQYRIYVKDTAKDKITLPLTIEYKDINNNDYTKDLVLDVKLYSTKEALKLGLENRNQTWIYILIVIIIIAAFIFFRSRKKKNK